MGEKNSYGLRKQFQEQFTLRKCGNNGSSLSLTISVPGTKPALQTLPEIFLTQAFAFCQKWQNWALDVLFGSSVATCIVSSDSLPGKPSHSRSLKGPLGPFQWCCNMKTSSMILFCPSFSQPWTIDIWDQIILCGRELSCVLWGIWKHPWLLLTR